MKNTFLKLFEKIKPLYGYLSLVTLSLIPILLVLIWFIYRYTIGSYHYTMADPEYAYLLNGVSMLKNNMLTDFFDHPGTPLQLLIATISKVIQTYRGTELIDDVIKNPELYLQAVNAVNLFSLSLILFFCGYILYKKTGKVIPVILIQISPLLFDNPFTLSRMNLETLLITFMALFVFIVLFFLNHKVQNNRKYEYIFAFIVALIISTKLSTFPIAFIPFFLLLEKRKRLIYSISVVALFLIFSYPVFSNLNRFFSWLKVLFIHTGNYGKGNATIINWHEFISNYSKLYNLFKTVFILYYFNILTLIIIWLKKILKKEESQIQIYNALLGITLTITLQIFIVCKHYGPSYFLPAQLLVYLNLYILLNYYSNYFKANYKKYLIPSLYLILIIIFIVNIRNNVRTDIFNLNKYAQYRAKTTHFLKVNPIKGAKLFYTSAWNPYQEEGLWFGNLFTGKYETTFSERLNTLYKDCYFNIDYNDNFIDFNNKHYTFENLLDKFDTLNIIDNQFDFEFKNYVNLKKISDSLKTELIYSNIEIGETFSRVSKK